MNYTVYMHIAPSGKRYIGITKQQPKSRWRGGSGYKRHTHFYNAIKKYGWDNIEHIVLYSNVSKEFAIEKEIELISKYKCNDKRYGYNISNGGEGSASVSEEVRKILSISHKGQIPWNKGKKGIYSEEYKLKLSNGRKDKKSILQYDLQGNIIKEWESIKSIERELNIANQNIIQCCKGKCKTIKGYVWKYKQSA